MVEKVFRIIKICAAALALAAIAVSAAAPGAVVSVLGTDAPKEEVASGDLNPDDLVFPELIFGEGETHSEEAGEADADTVPEEGNADSDAESGFDQQTEVESPDAQKIIDKYVGMMQRLESSYSGRLAGEASAAKAEFYALPKEERNLDNKQAIVSAHLGNVEALQASCDAEVAAVLSSLRAELVAIGADTAIVSELQGEYEARKSAAMSRYMAEYRN